MKTPRAFSFWSLLPLVLVLACDMWNWLEEALAYLAARREEARRRDYGLR